MIQEKDKSIVSKKIIKVLGDDFVEHMDDIAVEEPLQISISILEPESPITNKNISITMRTPGHDQDLAIGFLFTEGIIQASDQIKGITLGENSINVQLNNSENIDLGKLERHFYTSSSCGVCGKASIEAIKTICRLPPSLADFQVDKNLIKSFPGILKQEQNIFNNTGGIHAAALFNVNGELITIREDVGRHNALDKIIGHLVTQDLLPLDQHLLFLSGRASFELIQKAAMAGIHFIMAVGAPSSLAVEMALEHDITLIGFLNETRYNIYTGPKRIKI
ncbi:formate dehydrogenase accessory sulfurtransferase FdhD [Arenibacter palladensis]|uniref:formate dehydrogenase accessory sulfurtransferase FdhD n=1 Tax=Arenibacter palladensis TaxID=237373 RepID=UPI0026E48087|nr:formate dehydrogenase accessory sulfurtransferase FdhD [Arenibacter palladensis]MDO6605472.1 formate dehydrogenase accessory sulfurtransferase FdhD [Arenibacter palladensis]|tara:strand:+ start:1838 stop:2671 length:834 start_codon:yes stop_codon:yes gene_type:complete